MKVISDAGSADRIATVPLAWDFRLWSFSLFVGDARDSLVKLREVHSSSLYSYGLLSKLSRALRSISQRIDEQSSTAI